MNKMIKCKACGIEIAKGTKCVHCGKDQRNFFGKHKVLTGLAVIIVIGVMANSGNDKPTLVTPTATKPAVTEKTVVAEPVAKDFKVGDTVKLNDYTVKVNKVYVYKSTNEFMVPKAGKEYFAVDCTITNTSSIEQIVSSMLMFKVVDKDGRACEYAISGEGGGQLDGTVGAGRKMTGVYTVEAPKGATGLELEFDASFISSGQVIVKLN